MVSILPNNARNPWQVIGQSIGANLEQNLPQAVQRNINRSMLQSSLDQVSKIANDPNASSLDITLAAMKAGAGIPGSERYLGQLVPEIVKMAEARRAQNFKQPGQENGDQTQRPVSEESQPQQMSPNGSKNQNDFFPSNVGVQGGPGNVAQPGSTGVKIPPLTPDLIWTKAQELANQRTQSGSPTTPEQTLPLVEKYQQQIIDHNNQVDIDTGNRVKGQETYGTKAVDLLKTAYPPSANNPEMQAVFKRKGEEASQRGSSEADIEQYLAGEARKFANSMVNIEKDLSAPRLQNSLYRKPHGTYKNFEDSAKDLRNHLDPLLKDGLYDTARNMLAKKGYGVEEREIIINPMGEREKTILNRVPKARINPDTFMPEENNPVDIAEIKKGLMDLKKANPNFSPVLARKFFEDKRYDWRTFKNAWNSLIQDGGLALEDDQKTQQGNLDTPPLTLLEYLLEGINIIGR